VPNKAILIVEGGIYELFDNLFDECGTHPSFPIINAIVAHLALCMGSSRIDSVVCKDQINDVLSNEFTQTQHTQEVLFSAAPSTQH